MEASADWPSLQKRGFLVVKQFLSADQCAELAKCYETLPAATDSIGFGVRWAIEACCTAFCLARPHEPAYPLQLGAGLLWATARESVRPPTGGAFGITFAVPHGSSFHTLRWACRPA